MKINLMNAQKGRQLLMWAALLGLLLAACGPATPQPNDATGEESAEGGSRVTASGLEYVEVAAGTGVQAQPGDLVSVHYTGTLEDGTEFDSSAGGDPFTFVLGQGSVIPGWA